MCCIFSSIFALGPRVGLLIWWFFNPLRFATAFSSFIWPVLGILFLPWTTLVYAIIWRPATGVFGLDWLWLGLAFLADVSAYGGAYGSRGRQRR